MDRIEQLEQMRMGVAMRHPVSLRGFSCHLRPLTIAEMVRVMGEVKQELMATPEGARTPILQTALTARKTLEVASTDFDGKIQSLTGYILDLMTPDELIHLFNQYQSIMDKVNPSLESMSPEELQALIDAVKKNPSQLIELSFYRVVQIARFLLTKDG